MTVAEELGWLLGWLLEGLVSWLLEGLASCGSASLDSVSSCFSSSIGVSGNVEYETNYYGLIKSKLWAEQTNIPNIYL